ncbi:DUF5719 family protein [Pseudactinotalea suaedae]|jgi:hypothetical protein|uniref:DUF5719 family protein n=1 Tax=Pseudactinotalea suaedae TaxID=1524924 RepID=UPI0012E23739|nr:DUF5719 family protein [Pseudactinotalea suaedae]
MARSRAGVLRRIGLVLSGLLVLALTVGVGLAGTVAGPPETTAIEVEPLSVGAGATTWVCAAAPTLPTAAAGDDVDYDPDLGTGGGAVATLAELTALGSSEAPTMTVGPIAEAGSDAGTAGPVATMSQPDVTDPYVGVVEPFADGVPLVGGVSVARADAGDLRGLSVTTCQQPVSSAVLVGGSTQLGASARLVLSNPGETTASVTLTGWGATGPLPDIAPMVVPAGGVRTMLLETISLEPRIAIRLDVEGGRVVPTIQDTSLDGLIPAGTELVGPAADPTTDLTIAGSALSDADSASALLRLVNPGVDAATVQVEMLGPEGAAVLAGAEASVIEPGTVADISLAGVPTGLYGVRVTSDVPITGAVQLTRTGTAGEEDPDTAPVDIAWLPASAPVSAGVLPVPSGLVDTAVLTVTNPGTADTDVSVRTYDAAGQVGLESTVPVTAGATAELEVPDGTIAVLLEGEGFLASAVVAGDAENGSLISAYPIVNDPYTEQSVAVRVTD